jgi:hypothetical protein
MSKEEKTPTVTGVAQRNVGHRFQLAHPRYGGKKRNSTQQVRDLCAEMDCDPMRFMLEIVKTGVTTQVVIENGKKKKVEVVADLATRTDLAKYVSRFMYPTLTATAVTGANDGPIELATLDLTPILANPELARAAQEIALQLAEADAAQIDADYRTQPKLLEAEFTD